MFFMVMNLCVFFFAGRRAPAVMVSAVPRRGDARRPGTHFNVQASGTDCDPTQSGRICGKFVSHWVNFFPLKPLLTFMHCTLHTKRGAPPKDGDFAHPRFNLANYAPVFNATKTSLPTVLFNQIESLKIIFLRQSIMCNENS